MNRYPDFLIIGAMKCATSSLHDQLAQQPGLFLSKPKEPNFFSDDDQYARGLEWYSNLFSAAEPDDLCGESSTHYTKRPALPHTLARMRPVLNKPKLIYVMRHPVDRLVSHYVHEWTENRIRGSIDHAVATLPDLADFSCYAMQLEPYLDTYGPQNVLPVFYEFMIQNPQATIECIGQFIGYNRTPRWNHELKASNVGSERLRKSHIRNLLTDTPILRDIRRRVIPKSWTSRVKQLWQMKSKPKLGEETLTRLHETFNNDLERLGSWLGVSLNCSNFRDVVTAAPLEWSHSLASRD